MLPTIQLSGLFKYRPSINARQRDVHFICYRRISAEVLSFVIVFSSRKRGYFHGSRLPKSKLPRGKPPPAPKTAVPAKTGVRGALSCKEHLG
jgi:hypothetical protein